MSLLKLPFLWSMTWGLHFTMTSPNPPPSAQEILHSTGIIHSLTLQFPRVAKVCGHYASQSFFWTAAALETSVILSNNFPASPFSKTIIDALLDPTLPPSAISNIRITPVYLLGWLLVASGAIVRLMCYRALGNQFTFQLGIRRDHHLITTGPYAFVRHPSYTGASFVGLGCVICHFTDGSWLMECSAYLPKTWQFISGLFIVGIGIAGSALARRMKEEDDMLKNRFGKEWVAWAVEVPYRIFPGIY